MKNIINNLKLTYLIGYNWLQNIDNMIFLISILLLSTPLLNIGKYRFEIIIITLLIWLIGLIICSLIWVLLRKCEVVNEKIPTETIPDVTDVILKKEEYKKWLLKRIDISTTELNNTTELDLKISKGAKLTAYKEMLNYINNH